MIVKYVCHYYCSYCKESQDCEADDDVVVCTECLGIVAYTQDMSKKILVKKKNG